jgi:putative MATE family efflux protein
MLDMSSVPDRRTQTGSERVGAPVHAGPSEAGPLEDRIGAPSPADLGVWELAWPSMALYALHALVALVDFAFVSSLGTAAVAAVGVAMQIHFFVFALLAAITTGTLAIVAREVGAGHWPEAARATRASVALAALLGALLMALAPWSREAVSLLGVRGDVADLGGACLATLLCFNVPFAIEIALSMALRGAGDVRTPLAVGVLANGLNVVLCYAFVFGRLGAPELGAVGSALAGGISFSVGAGTLAVYWWRGALVLPRRVAGSSLTADTCRRLLRIGLPTAAEQSAFQLGLLVFLAIIALYGTPAVSAYLIGVRILSLCFVPGLGFSTAAGTLVGHRLGARRVAEARRLGWRACAQAMAVMAGVGLAIALAAPDLAQLFGAAGEDTIRLAIVFIYILGAAQPLMAVEFALGGALRGAGDTRFPLLAILIGLFVFRLGTALAIARPLAGGVTAVWLCLLADYAVKALLLSLRFASDRWTSVRV